jgi:hypothetical protein
MLEAKIGELKTLISTETSIKLASFLALFVFLIAQNPVWNMLWDADGYLNSAIHWVTGGPHEQVSEQLFYRGVLSSFVYYIPAFIGINYFEPTQFGTYIYVFVMVQNALIISWIAAFVLPRITNLIKPVKATTIPLIALLGYYIMKGFAPYSLMDLWAVACIIPVVYMIHSHRRMTMTLSGVLLGVCLNLRPSYLLVIVLLFISALVIKRASLLLMVPGFFVSQVPQILYNKKWYDSFSIFPLGLGKITGDLATFASYSIRYDTVAYRPFAQGGLSFCDKKMKDIALNSMPESTFETGLLLLQNPGNAFLFIIKKTAAAFWWPVTTPYFEHNPIVNSVFGFFVLAIMVFGVSKVIKIFVGSSNWRYFLGMFAVIAGFFINLVLYSNETRYGLSVLLIAICGIAIAIDSRWRSSNEDSSATYLSKWNIATLIVFTVLFLTAIFTLMGDFGFTSIANCS